MSTVLPFPDRGGAGWRCDPNAKWGDFDMTNVRIAAQAFWAKHGSAGFAKLGRHATPCELAMAALLPLLGKGISS